jgi:hypothetical protein
MIALLELLKMLALTGVELSVAAGKVKPVSI